MISNCPCGSKNTYEACCELIHNDISQAITAEQLMRSRYTAFTKGMGDYLLKSHHSSTRPVIQMPEIIKWANSVDWKFLKIKQTSKGKSTDQVGTVKFKAHFIQKNKEDFILENSKFVRENDHWAYLGIV